jgi:hypothetical protein
MHEDTGFRPSSASSVCIPAVCMDPTVPIKNQRYQ